jgi:hypothetical protein
MILVRAAAVVLPLAEEAGKEEIKSGWGGLIFMGLFFLALIALGIWWLTRS